MTSLEPLFDTLSRLSIDTLLRGAILILVGYVLIRLILKLVRRALNRTNPVSYTHLDVYKRQAQFTPL